MSSTKYICLKFYSPFGEVEDYELSVLPGSDFDKIFPEIANAFGVNAKLLNVAPTGGAALTPTDLQQTVEKVVEKYGNVFGLINRELIPKGSNSQNFTWRESAVEREL